MSTRIERILTKLADAGPCCAGCRNWHYMNSLVGECQRSAPVSGAERVAMLGVRGCSLEIGAGHVLTRRDHHCGEFADNREGGDAV